MKFIVGKKVEMTQKFLADGRVAPVTVVKAYHCEVTQIKGQKDGYTAVQLGYGKKDKRHLKEFRLDKTDGIEVGKSINVSTFQKGDILKLTATSKGKGFQGVVKRHGFHGSPKTHGHKDQIRMPGSIGTTDPARVFKGKRMAGRMGGETVTVQNLELIDIDNKEDLLFVKGAVPGARNSVVTIVADGELKFVDAKEKQEETKEEVIKEEVKE